MRDESVALLARSLFSLLVLAFLASLITFALILAAPDSPSPAFSTLRLAILAACAALVIMFFLAMLAALRADEAKILALSRKISRAFSQPFLALLFCGLLLELNIIAAIALTSIAPAYIGPGRFLLAVITVLLFCVVLILHWDALRNEFTKRMPLLAFSGMSILLFGGGLLVYALNLAALEAIGVNDVLRGSLDYRPLVFIADGKEPSASQFWSEQSQTKITWMPFVYWVVAPFDGEYIRVDAQGRRATWNINSPTAPLRLYFFGGSTMWGEGARDDYTIPSHVMRLLATSEHAAYGENYGQTGYVSTQDTLLFQFQLAQGNIPDLAIFYQGFNDTLAAYLQGYAGVSLQEDMRAADSEAGRILRAGRPLLRLPLVDMASRNFILAAAAPSSADSIAERWLANMRITQRIAASYGVHSLFFWQPALYEKQNLSAFEQEILNRLNVDLPGFLDLYKDTGQAVKARLSDEEKEAVIFLTELFKEDQREIFYDLVHITEEGNLEVAHAITSQVLRIYR